MHLCVCTLGVNVGFKNNRSNNPCDEEVYDEDKTYLIGMITEHIQSVEIDTLTSMDMWICYRYILIYFHDKYLTLDWK